MRLKIKKIEVLLSIFKIYIQKGDIVIYHMKYIYLVFVPISGTELSKPLEFPKC